MKKNVDEFKKKIQEGPAATPAPPGFFSEGWEKRDENRNCPIWVRSSLHTITKIFYTLVI